MTTDKPLAEATFHVLLAASYVSHETRTTGTVVAVLAYLGLTSLYFAKQRERAVEERQEESQEVQTPLLRLPDPSISVQMPLDLKKISPRGVQDLAGSKACPVSADRKDNAVGNRNTGQPVRQSQNRLRSRRAPLLALGLLCMLATATNATAAENNARIATEISAVPAWIILLVVVGSLIVVGWFFHQLARRVRKIRAPFGTDIEFGEELK